MDENFCENETSESVDGQKAKETENPPPLEIYGSTYEEKTGRIEISNRCASSLDASVSGPSTNFPLLEHENKEITQLVEVIKPTAPVQEGGSVEEPPIPSTPVQEPPVPSTPVQEPPVPSTPVERITELVEVIQPTAPVKEGSTVEEPPIPSTPVERITELVEVIQPTAPDKEGSTVEEPPILSTPVQGPSIPPIPVQRITNLVELSRPVKESNANTSPLICVDEQPRVRLAPEVEKQLGSRKLSLGPPPSYSFVMKQKKKLKSVPSPDPMIVNRTPPPTYTGSRGVFMAPEDRTCAYPSFVDPVWRSHSQAALCPRCGILVLTTTHAHDSMATHVTALALCLFGCWPCCLLPYCINGCKNMYHYCPICQTFLGLYKPW